MDLSRLESTDEYCWTIPASETERRAAIVMYGSRPLLESMDDKVLEQITNVAKLPGLVGPAMTMPDAHWGYGFPIGGVAAFDAEKGGIISAGGVGFDISCGIRCLRSNVDVDDIRPHVDLLADSLYRDVPAGLGQGGTVELSAADIDEMLLGGAAWAVGRGFGASDDLEYIEEHGRMSGAVPENVSDRAKKRQHRETGTLGSGNHYLEVQVVERVFDEKVAAACGLRVGQIVVSIHCGSRGLGHQVGTDYLISLAKGAQRLGIELPERELACAPIQSPEGQQYIGAMNAAINCAFANRQILTHLTRATFARRVPGSVLETLFDVSHNTCKAERHRLDEQERLLYVHRKGATRAFGPGTADLPERYRQVGQPVLIGGSMGTGSYVLVGTEESER
ncbi:MAG: RtcB family protein, partial [Chloroflexota bacterium]|nr:RtcB family protein [Chloroflexota bacterium]